MGQHQSSIEARQRILSACVKFFIRQGFYKTTVSEILEEAKVSCSTFQNLFKNKYGVLFDLTEFMFDSQFAAARSISEKDLKPVYVYAVETAIQMTLSELNENLREIYVEAYSDNDTTEYIFRRTSVELKKIFSDYNPGYSEGDFYELEIGTAGIMRNYMARKCDQYFTLERKLERFLEMSMKVYNVPKDEREEVIAFVLKIDIRKTANQIMQRLFKSLAMNFGFELGEKM